MQASRAELQVKNERNASLIETLSSLEVLSRRDSSELSMSTEFSTNGLPNMAYLSSTLGSGEFLKTIDPQQSAQIHEGILQLQRHLSKYRLRAKMFEDMSNIFRSAFLAAVSTHHTTEGGPNSYWMLSAAPYGRIVEVVRKSYEESMSLLEDQVESCLGVIRQNNSYMTELRTRLEDTLRALYRCVLYVKAIYVYLFHLCLYCRNGRGEPALAGSVESSQQQHIELLSKSLKQAQEKYEANATALGEERRSGRHRHEALVSELSSVVTTCEQAQEQTVKWRDESEVCSI